MTLPTPPHVGRSVALAACVAAVLTATACQPLWGGTSAGPSSPYAVHVATPHLVKAPAITGYPWAADQSWSADAYGETRRQCVSFAAWYLNSHGTPFGYLTRGPKGTAIFGNASSWDAAARSVGFTVSRTPQVGSVAQWESSERSSWSLNGATYGFLAGAAGHVGIVTRLYADGTVAVAQYNLSEVRSFSVSRMRAPRYIYVPLASPHVW